MPQDSQRFPPQLWVWLSSEPEFTDDRIALRIRQLCKCRLHSLLKIPLFDVLKGFCRRFI